MSITTRSIQRHPAHFRRMEFPGGVVDEFLAGREPSPLLSYGVALFVIRR